MFAARRTSPRNLLGRQVGLRAARVDQFRTIEIAVSLLEIQMRVDVMEGDDPLGVSQQSSVEPIDGIANWH